MISIKSGATRGFKMKNHYGHLSFLQVLVICLMLGLGCSEAQNTTAPSTQNQDVQITGNAITDAQTDTVNNRSLWGFWLIGVDPETMTAKIIPVRAAQTHWNVLKWLENGPCMNCFKIQGITPSGLGTLLVDVEIKHPFSSPNLTGFDVRGIAMFSGSHDFPNSGLLTSDRTAGEGELVNADGFTTLYNPETAGSGPGGLQGYLKGKFASASYPNSTLNGYIRHYSPGAVNSRNAFYAGDSILATYEIAMPSGPFIFGYAVDASWAPPINKPVTNPMTDFPSSANCPEPWKIEVSDNPVGQGLTDLGGSTVLTIDVYDWQGKSSHHDPVIECPDLFDGAVTAGWQSDGSGYSTYNATISNDKLALAGMYKCLISVEDNENASAPDWLDLTAYQIHTLEVVPFDNTSPIPQANAVPNPQTVCEQVQFEDDGSYDPDGGSIVMYEWDWDNDGVYDEEGASVSHAWNQVGTNQVGFKVTDDEGDSNEIDLEVEIQNALPTAMAQADLSDVPVGQSVHFTSVGSQDNDCGDASITLYEWDFNYDGSFSADAEGASVDHSFSSGGNYSVMLRVTDDEGGYGYLDPPLMVHVYQSLPPVIKMDHEPLVRNECEEIMFWDDGSYDPDGGLIVSYEWDWENDGVFDEEGEGVAHSWNSTGTHYVQYRVTDDEGESTMLQVPLWVTINDTLPTATSTFSTYGVSYGENITFDGSYSVDGTCLGDGIVDWGWDWDNDTVVDEHGKTAVHSWDSKGQYEVQLQVTDDEGSTAWLLVPIQVDVFAGWARTWGGPTIDVCTAACTDSSGNVYAAGSFDGSVDFDPGIDEHILTAVGSVDSYLCKYDPNGDFLWALSWGSTSFDNALGLAAYGDSVYVTGFFSGTIDLDPNPDVSDIKPFEGYSDVFVSKFNSSGDYLWGRVWGGSWFDRGLGITVENSESFIEIAGLFQNTVDFDPSGSADEHTSNGLSDCFLTRLTPSGDYSWGQTWGGTGDDMATAVTVDVSDNTYVTGSFNSTVDFNPFVPVDNGTSNGASDVFLTKRTSSGNYDFTLAWGGVATDQGAAVAGGKTYAEVWITGSFMDTVDFDPSVGDDYRTSNGYSDIFLSGFSSTGSRYFTNTWGGTGIDTGNGVAYRTDDTVFVTGKFQYDVDFDTGAGSQTATSKGETDIFLSAFVWNGPFLWAETWGGSYDDSGYSVACLDAAPKPIFVGGEFEGNVDFNPGPGVDKHESPETYSDAFISRFPEDGQW